MGIVINGTRYLYIEDVAMLLGMSTVTVRRYVKQKRLRGKKFTRRWIFNQEDIDRFYKEEGLT